MSGILDSRNRPRAYPHPQQPGLVVVNHRGTTLATLTAAAAEDLAIEATSAAQQARGDSGDEQRFVVDCEQDLAAARAEIQLLETQLAASRISNDGRAQAEIDAAHQQLAQAETDHQKELAACERRNAELNAVNSVLQSTVAAALAIREQLEDQLAAKRKTLDWIRRYSQSHAEHQDPTVWLHALTVDIPEACS